MEGSTTSPPRGSWTQYNATKGGGNVGTDRNVDRNDIHASTNLSVVNVSTKSLGHGDGDEKRNEEDMVLSSSSSTGMIPAMTTMMTSMSRRLSGNLSLKLSGMKMLLFMI